MHLEDGQIPEEYTRYIGKKIAVNISALLLLVLLFFLSISIGAVSIPVKDVFRTLFSSQGPRQWQIIILRIRLPQALTAMVAGAGLAVSGTVMQSILRNPLGSPFTLGISNAAAFGAAFSVMIVGTGVMHSSGADALSITNPYVTTLFAFLFCLAATAVILVISKIRRASPETMILTGVALGSLFTAGTMLLQYFADDVQLAAMVFWTFGDAARADWRELIIISAVTGGAFLYFLLNSWNYNGISAGDETAKGLGVPVERSRLVGMVVASLVTATTIAFIGIIGFVGLVCPHIVRRIIGDDHRFLIPGTLVTGAFLLLAADTVARVILAPHVLPVAILTAFIGAPVFIYLLIKGYKK